MSKRVASAESTQHVATTVEEAEKAEDCASALVTAWQAVTEAYYHPLRELDSLLEHIIVDKVHAKRVVDALMEQQPDPDDAWDSASQKIAMHIIRAYSLRFTAEPPDGCDIVLTHVGPNRVNVINAICDITGMGFKRTHQVIEGAVTTVKKGVPKDKAETIKQRLEAIGATVEIR